MGTQISACHYVPLFAIMYNYLPLIATNACHLLLQALPLFATIGHYLPLIATNACHYLPLFAPSATTIYLYWLLFATFRNCTGGTYAPRSLHITKLTFCLPKSCAGHAQVMRKPTLRRRCILGYLPVRHLWGLVMKIEISLRTKPPGKEHQELSTKVSVW